MLDGDGTVSGVTSQSCALARKVSFEQITCNDSLIITKVMKQLDILKHYER